MAHLVIARSGASLRMVPLYSNLASVSEDEIADALARAITPRTRVVAVTWVHSSTGLKLPVRRIADVVAAENARRIDSERILLCVDLQLVQRFRRCNSQPLALPNRIEGQPTMTTQHLAMQVVDRPWLR